MKYSLLAELMTQLERYEQDAAPEQQSVRGFADWLRVQTAPPVNGAIGVPFGGVENTITKLVVYLYRYARMYAKKVTDQTPIDNFDDFPYLVSLLGQGAMTKIELIEYNIQEKASGMEVIKRLLQKGFVLEQPHPTDGRSKLLSVSEAGIAVMREVFSEMQAISQLISGNLSLEEKEYLAYLLQKLHEFHNPLFKEYKDAPLPLLVEAAQKYLASRAIS